ncbi:MAG TPA: DUF5695 domain-containing protein [Candidatus Acidoferrum sp.]|nr:DUF5695 domain-containing protein [Candidatus Acidoferrum sp.]
MKTGWLRRAGAILASALLVSAAAVALTKAAAQERPAKPAPGPMLEQGTFDVDTPDFTLSLVRSSQTVAALKPKGAGGFDFTPGDLLVARSKDGYYHLGDLDLRLRSGTSGAWTDYSTAHARKPVTSLPASGNVLAAADLAPTFGADLPLEIKRYWALADGKLALRFELRNTTAQPVQIGALGIPMIFNNILTDRSLDEAHVKCSFYDPYIGEDAGYLQVTRLNGHGPTLLVVPLGHTRFEAYKPILSPERRRGAPPEVPIFTDPTPRWVTFEGFYNWMVYSQAFAENEWKNAKQWNLPTMTTIAPGEMKIYGVRFVLSDSIRHIEDTLAANNRPVAVGVPGYVLPMDIHARLFLKYSQDVKSLGVEPEGAISIERGDPTAHGWKTFTLTGHTWGRARLTITYQDGLVQTIQYFVTKPEAQALADLGHFLTTKQWFADPKDPFHRSPSAMTYDRDLNQIVAQDSRVWVAGLSDEGGAGSWLATAMKEFGEPNKEEIDKFEQFVDGVLWGHLQYEDGPRAHGVRKSLFYYQPDELPPGFYRADLNWKSWTSWNKQASEAVDRSYDYPHVAAAYWVLYRLARNNQGLVTNHPWDWYLNHAYETSMAMTKYAGGLAEFGQMEGDIFLAILDDLKREGMTEQAAQLQAAMKARADRWKQQAYPYGSEMPWDSTGQEEVYGWMKYFGYEDKADVTLNAILGYDPTVPHWGYNGSARRYWDFVYAGKYQRLERQLHHYGSSLNAIPLLAEYRQHPDDLYLLRVGYGGTMGTLTDIDQDGFGAVAFHAFPDMLRFDGITGDYGPNFFGHAWNTATYIVHHPEFGWLAFGGNVEEKNGTITVTPLDSFRTRVYVAPLGLWLTLDSGKFQSIEVSADAGKTGSVRCVLDPATEFTSTARLRIETPAAAAGTPTRYHPAKAFRAERGAYVIALSKEPTSVEITANQ